MKLRLPRWIALVLNGREAGDLSPFQPLRPSLPAVSSSASHVFIALLFLHLWLSQSTLDVVQVGVELLLVVALAWMLVKARCRLSVTEVVLVAIFVLTLTVAMLYNSIQVALLNSKIFGLSILCLLVFTKLRFDMRLAVWVLCANVAMTLYQAFFGDPIWFEFVVNTVGGSWRQYLNSRPLGLFMSTHVSATLTAIFFIWLSGRSKLRLGVGFVVLFFNASFYIMASYAAHVGARVLAWWRLDKIVAAIGITIVALAFLNADAVTKFDLTKVSPVFTSREQVGFTVITGQLLNMEAYSTAFTLVPLDSAELSADFVDDKGNEVMYFTVIQQGGFILAALYFILLMMRIPGFRVFMAVSMLHYGMPTTPIVVLLLIQWARTAADASVFAPLPDRSPNRSDDNAQGPVRPVALARRPT